MHLDPSSPHYQDNKSNSSDHSRRRRRPPFTPAIKVVVAGVPGAGAHFVLGVVVGAAAVLVPAAQSVVAGEAPAVPVQAVARLHWIGRKMWGNYSDADLFI